MASPSTNLKEAEDLVLSLSEALSCGDSDQAAQLCERLCQLSVPVSVSIKSQVYPQDPIRLTVGVEDAQSETYIPVTVMVSSGMTIAQLKEKISQEFGFHPLLQRWVIGKRLALDQDSLYSHGIRTDGDQAFLFILSAQAAHLTRQQCMSDLEEQRLTGIMKSMVLVSRGPGGAGAKTPSPLETSPPTLLPRNPTAVKPALPPKPQLGWACTMCTYINKPTRPGCEICGGERPEDYKVPDIYQPDQEEIQRIEQEQLALLQYELAQQEERNQNYLYLLATEDQNLILSTSEADCPICFSTLMPGEGIVLRECLHTFCRECLKSTIVNCQDPEVSCPDNCDSKLLDREIKEMFCPSSKGLLQSVGINLFWWLLKQHT